MSRATPTPEGNKQLRLEPGARPVSGYELVRQLGRGGFGEVWQAKGAGGVAVVLKFIRLDEKSSGVEVRSLGLMKEIRHPHLLSLHGAWRREHYLIVAMDLGEKTLYDRLREVHAQGLPGIPRKELLEYLREAAKGIDHLNGLGIQHRDIKPQNLLLVGGGVKVADFGLARLLEHTVGQHSGAMTPSYAAPEFLNGQTTAHSDQYSLAVTYCYLRGGRLPFEGNTAQVLAGHLQSPPDLTMVPEAERPALARALAKKADERWPSCRAFAEALAEVLAGAVLRTTPARVPSARRKAEAAAGPRPAPPAHSTSVTPRVETTTPERRRKWPVPFAGVVALGVTGLLLALVVAILVGGGGRKGSSPDRGQPDARLAQKLAPAADPKQGPAAAPRKQEDPRVPKKDGPPPVAANGPADKPAQENAAVPPAPVAAPREVLTNFIGMKLVLIPAGKFLMGSPKDDPDHQDDEEQHPVEITRPFYLGVYEITQAEYERVMGTNPSDFSRNGALKDKVGQEDTERFPVEMVSWEDAVEFCRKLSESPEEKRAGRVYRLPTEAEWEYACRGGARESTYFNFDRRLSSTQANFNGSSPHGSTPKGPYLGRTTTVGSYAPNAFGLYDMHGNVHEWCADWYDKDYYRQSPPKDPQGPPTGGERVMRSGGWGHNDLSARTAARSKSGVSQCRHHIGYCWQIRRTRS